MVKKAERSSGAGGRAGDRTFLWPCGHRWSWGAEWCVMKQLAELRLYNPMPVNYWETNLWAALALLAAASTPLVPPSMVQGARAGWLHLATGEPGFSGNTFRGELLSQGMGKKPTPTWVKQEQAMTQFKCHLRLSFFFFFLFLLPWLPALSHAQQGSTGNRWFPTKAEPPVPLGRQTQSHLGHLFCSCSVPTLGSWCSSLRWPESRLGFPLWGRQRKTECASFLLFGWKLLENICIFLTSPYTSSFLGKPVSLSVLPVKRRVPPMGVFSSWVVLPGDLDATGTILIKQGQHKTLRCPAWTWHIALEPLKCHWLRALLRAAINCLATGWDIGFCPDLPFFLPPVVQLKQGDVFPSPSSVKFVFEGMRQDYLFFFVTGRTSVPCV